MFFLLMFRINFMDYVKKHDHIIPKSYKLEILEKMIVWHDIIACLAEVMDSSHIFAIWVFVPHLDIDALIYLSLHMWYELHVREGVKKHDAPITLKSYKAWVSRKIGFLIDLDE